MTGRAAQNQRSLTVLYLYCLALHGKMKKEIATPSLGVKPHSVLAPFLSLDKDS